MSDQICLGSISRVRSVTAGLNQADILKVTYVALSALYTLHSDFSILILDLHRNAVMHKRRRKQWLKQSKRQQLR